MADRPDDGRRDYEWLYGEGDPDDDATRRIPISPRPSGRGDDRRADGGASGAGVDDDQRTRVIPASGSRPATASQQPRRQSATAPPPPPPGRTAQGAPRPSRPARSRRHTGRWIALVIALIVAFYLVMPLIAWSRVDKVAAEPGGDRPAETPGTTYLLVGSDSREGLSAEQRKELTTGDVGGARTDTIMLMHVPRFGGKTLLLSLPRDSIVDIPGRGSGHKINAAYAFGGPKLLVQTVEQATGLRVDDYIEIGLGGFAGIVDAVGGVEICPKQDMKDPLAGLDIKAGCQEADGTTALAYVRSRHVDATGDIARVERQREVVGKVADQAASPWTFINPVRYGRLNLAAADALTVGENVGPIDLAKFAWGMRKVTGNDGLTCTVPLADMAVHWDTEAANRLFEQIRQDDTGSIECSRTGGL